MLVYPWSLVQAYRQYYPHLETNLNNHKHEARNFPQGSPHRPKCAICRPHRSLFLLSQSICQTDNGIPYVCHHRTHSVHRFVPYPIPICRVRTRNHREFGLLLLWVRWNHHNSSIRDCNRPLSQNRKRPHRPCHGSNFPLRGNIRNLEMLHPMSSYQYGRMQ